MHNFLWRQFEYYQSLSSKENHFHLDDWRTSYQSLQKFPSCVSILIAEGLSPLYLIPTRIQFLVQLVKQIKSTSISEFLMRDLAVPRTLDKKESRLAWQPRDRIIN